MFLLFLGNDLLLYSPDLCFECARGQGQRGSTVFLIILWINIWIFRFLKGTVSPISYIVVKFLQPTLTFT